MRLRRAILAQLALAAALAPASGAAPPAPAPDSPPVALHLIARADAAQDLGYVVLRGDRLALEHLLAARSIPAFALAQSDLERRVASGTAFPVSSAALATATRSARRSLARASAGGAQGVALVSRGAGPAVALVQGQTQALRSLADAGRKDVVAVGSVRRTASGCDYDESLHLPPGERIVGALTLSQSADGCANAVGITVPLTDALTVGWATAVRASVVLGRVASCTGTACAGSGWEGVRRAIVRYTRQLQAIESGCSGPRAECSEADVAGEVRDRTRQLERATRDLVGDCSPADCPPAAGGTRASSAATCGSIWDATGVPCPLEASAGDYLGMVQDVIDRVVIPPVLDCNDRAAPNECVQMVLDLVEKLVPDVNCNDRAAPNECVQMVLDLVEKLVPDVNCNDRAAPNECVQMVLDLLDPVVDDAAEFVISAVGPDLAVQYIGGVLQGDVGSIEEADVLVDVETDLPAKSDDLVSGRKKRAAGQYRSYYEDPPKLDVTVVQPRIDFHYKGGCIAAPVYWEVAYEWRWGSGWQRDSHDEFGDANCGIAYSSGAARYVNYPFCNPVLPTYNIYNRTMVSGAPDGTLDGQSNPKKSGDCASWLRYRRRLERTYPTYKCWGDGCDNDDRLMGLAAKRVARTG